MEIKVYEDPENKHTTAPKMNMNRSLTSLRKPFEKRTNRGEAAKNDEAKQGPDKKSSSVLATTAGSRTKERSQSQTVRFDETSKTNNNNHRVPSKTSLTPASRTTPADFRRSLRSSNQPNTPVTPASESIRTMDLSPQTRLVNEMDSPGTLDDSLLLSPGGIESSSRPPAAMASRNLRESRGSPKLQRVLAAQSAPSSSTTTATTQRGGVKATATGPQTTEPSTVKPRSDFLSKRLPGRVPPKKVVPRNPSTKENSETVRGDRSMTRSSLARPPNDRRPAVRHQPIKPTEQKKADQQTASKQPTGAVVSSQKQLSEQSSAKLQVLTHSQPKGAPPPPSTQTSHASAWKAAGFVDSPGACTPGGRQNLFEVFTKAQSGPPTSATPKLPPRQATVASVASTSVQINCNPKRLESQAQQQCEMFTSWLNAILKPDDESNPFRALAVLERMKLTRQGGQGIWCSPEMEMIKKLLKLEIVRGKLKLRDDRDLYADRIQRDKLLELLMGSYETPWLRLGLETTFGVHIEPKTRPESSTSGSRLDLKPVRKTNLSRMQVALRDFITNELLFDKKVLKKYTNGKCKFPSGKFGEDYKTEMGDLILYRVMVLVVFLDVAKRENLLEQTLFREKSQQKSSKDILTAFCRDFLASSGDIVKQLQRVDLRVYHVQQPLDEIDFAVQNIAKDLRDGVRLARLAEVLTASPYQSLLKELRVPAGSRLPKIRNANLVLDHLAKNFTLPSGLAAHHVVDGNREKVLQLLWSLVSHFCLPSFLNADIVRKEIQRIQGRRGQQINSSNDFYPDGLNNEAQMIWLVLQWVNTVLRAYGVEVANLTSDFADGVPCCLLIRYYHPELLSRKEIHATERVNFGFTRKLPKAATRDLIRQNERHNWELAGRRMAQLGAMTGLPSADSDSPPQERTTLMGLAFLCQRLLQSRVQVQACLILQRHFRRKKKKQAAQLIMQIWRTRKENYYLRQRVKYFYSVLVIEGFVWKRKSQLGQLKKRKKSAIVIQALARRCIARSHFMLQALQLKIAIHFQLLWRRIKARQELELLRENARHKAAAKIQANWRGFLGKMDYLLDLMDVKRVQTIVRRNLAILEKKRRRWAVGVVQRTSRRYLACQKATIARHLRLREQSTICIQKYIRGFLSYRAFKMQYSASQTIQSFWRRHWQQLIFNQLRKNTVVIQTAFRRHWARSLFLRFIQALVRLQALRRGKIAFSSFRQKLRSALLLQRNVRKWKSKKEVSIRQQSIVTLQCLFRITKSKRMLLTLHAQRKLTASRRIQTWWRLQNTRNDFRGKREALIRIQCYTRRWLCYCEFQKSRLVATHLQCEWRCWSARSRFKEMRRKIVLCQSVCRAHLVNKMRHQQNDASVVLQSYFRMWRVRNLNNGKNEASVLIQTKWRSFFGRVQFRRFVTHVTRLQAALRRLAAQILYRQSRAAIALIQKRFRMHRALKELETRRLAKREKIRREGWASTVLQRHVRGALCRASLGCQHHAARNVQTMYRCFAAKQKFRTVFRRVTALQATMRTWIAKKGASRRRKAVLSIQIVLRMYIARKKVAEIRQEELEWLSAQTIQRFAHRMMARKICADKRERHNAAVVIQREVRSYIVSYRAARMIQKTYRCYRVLADYYWTIFHVIIPIQARIRRRLAIQKYDEQRYAVYVLQMFAANIIESRRQMREIECATKIQSFVRGSSVRQEQKLKHCAAILIQKYVRGFQAICMTNRWEDGATEFQRVWRGTRARHHYKNWQRAVIKIQAVVRRKLGQLLLTELQKERLRSAQLIQKQYRSYIQKMKLHKAAILVQALWRSRAFKRLKCKFVKIQSICRGICVRRWRTRKMTEIVHRLSQADASPHQRLGYRTQVALSVIQSMKGRNLLIQIKEALNTLEVCTRWSPECSNMFVAVGGTTIIYDLLRTCNRSLPHFVLKRDSLRVLSNVCHHCGWDNSCPFALATCLDLLQLHRDKTELFVPIVSLLKKAVETSVEARAVCATRENLKRLKSVHSLCKRRVENLNPPSIYEDAFATLGGIVVRVESHRG